MMLFAGPVAMPATLHRNKRKRHDCNEEHSPSKRPTLEHQAVSKLNVTKDQLSMLNSSQDNKFILPNGVHVSNFRQTPDSLGRRIASLNAEMALHLHFFDSGNVATSHQRVTKKEDVKTEANSHYTNGHQQKTTDLRFVPENGDEFMSHSSPSEVVDIQENKSTSGNDVGKSGLISMGREPTLVLTDYKRNGTDNSPDSSQEESANLESGVYMRRMASLNASACVTALMEPEKRSNIHKNSINSQLNTDQRSSSPVHSNDDLTSPAISPSKTSTQSPDSSSGHNSLPPGSLNSSFSSLSSPGDVDVCTPVYTFLALASIAAASNSELDDVPYNKLGLLYNGDTVHPHARVFYSSDTDLTLPDRIIPTIVPSQGRCVRSVTSNALAQKHVGKKKAAKGNNGWMPLGNPIKTIKYNEGSVPVVRRYYAGIKRKSCREIILVRDSVIIRSDSTAKEGKPYVAKIASIWQEHRHPGQLMMTVFWYYRPDEIDSVLAQSASFQKDELLASQHHDDNSVACIEEKCYILGVSQYCRYQAYIQCKKDNCLLNSRIHVPSMKPREKSSLIGQSYDFKTDLCGLSQSLDFEALTMVDPELVILCHRGYNHCAAKLISRAFSK